VLNGTDAGGRTRPCWTMRKKATTATDAGVRTAELRQMLVDRRGHVEQQIHGMRRDRRLPRQHDVGDDLDRSDAHVQGDMDFALLQMRADTLARIDGALLRLEAGTYGVCLACGGEIPAPRLRALPFAACCQACQQRRELGQDDAERLALRRARLPIFDDTLGA